MSKSIIVFIVSLMLSFYLYYAYVEDSSFNASSLLGTIVFSIVALIVIVSAVLSIKDIDSIITNSSSKDNRFKHSYYYMKFLIGILFLIASLYIFIVGIKEGEVNSEDFIFTIVSGSIFGIYAIFFIKSAKRNLQK